MATDLKTALQAFEDVNGLKLLRKRFPVVFETDSNIDDKRLLRGQNILLATYPRTGTTWLGQIVSLMLADEEKYEKTKATPLHDRVLFLEITYPGRDEPQISKVDSVPAPRAIKTHLPFRFIRRWVEEDRVKTIVTTRNPKDIIVSLFHFYQIQEDFNFKYTWTEYFDEVVRKEQQIFGTSLSWFEDWDKNKDKGDILFIQYEELKRDVVSGIKKIAQFLGITLSQRHLENVVRDSDIKQMKKTDTVGKEPTIKEGGEFVRSGQSGGWKNYFTVEQSEWFDKKYKKLYEELGIDVAYD